MFTCQTAVRLPGALARRAGGRGQKTGLHCLSLHPRIGASPENAREAWRNSPVDGKTHYAWERRATSERRPARGAWGTPGDL